MMVIDKMDFQKKIHSNTKAANAGLEMKMYRNKKRPRIVKIEIIQTVARL